MSSHSDYPRSIPLRMAANTGPALIGGLLLALVGVAAFFLSPAERAWSAFHFNWMFWSSVAIGMVMFAVALHITAADWAWSIERFALAGVAFLPISLVLLIGVFFGSEH